MKRSQTATEYLILIAVVIIIALIVVGILGGIPGIGGRLSEQTARAALSSSKIAVSEYAVSDYDTVLTVRNNNAETVEVESITLDEQECVGFADFTLRAGESRQVTCQNVFEANSDRAQMPIVIGYADAKTQANYIIEGKELVLVGAVADKYLDVLDNHLSFNLSAKGCWNATSNPHPICTCYDLNKTRTNLTWNYTMQNNIDFVRCMSVFGNAGWTSGVGWKPLGDCGSDNNCWSQPNNAYLGIFDGSNHIISSLLVNNASLNASSLFGNCWAPPATPGTIIGVGLVDVNISGDLTVAGLVGYGTAARVDHAYVMGKVTGTVLVGGLVGIGSGSIINNSYFSGNVSGFGNIGGLSGDSSGGQIVNSYAMGSVTGNNMVGGLVAQTAVTTIINSYTTSTVTCITQYCGGISGSNSGGSTITSVSWANHTSDTAIACIGQVGNLGGTNPAGCSVR